MSFVALPGFSSSPAANASAIIGATNAGNGQVGVQFNGISENPSLSVWAPDLPTAEAEWQQQFGSLLTQSQPAPAPPASSSGSGDAAIAAIANLIPALLQPPPSVQVSTLGQPTQAVTGSGGAVVPGTGATGTSSISDLASLLSGLNTATSGTQVPGSGSTVGGLAATPTPTPSTSSGPNWMVIGIVAIAIMAIYFFLHHKKGAAPVHSAHELHEPV